MQRWVTYNLRFDTHTHTTTVSIHLKALRATVSLQNHCFALFKSHHFTSCERTVRATVALSHTHRVTVWHHFRATVSLDLKGLFGPLFRYREMTHVYV